MSKSRPHGARDDTDDTDDTDVPLDWAVVDSCDTKGGNFSDFYDGSPAVLVHGDGPEEAALGTQAAEWYKSYLPGLEVTAYADLTDEQRAKNLMIVGGSDSNGLLTELSGDLPVWFEEDAFTFAGYRWEEPGHGIALIHPSPLADDRFVLLYAGNTVSGAWSTFSVYTGGYDFDVVRGRILQLEGKLCREGDPWGVKASRISFNDRDAWDERLADQQKIYSTYHTFYFDSGSDFDNDSDWMPDWQTDRHLDALDQLEVDALDYPLSMHLYATRKEKGEFSGTTGNANANTYNYEVHNMYGEGVYAVGAHEDVHVLAWYRIGDTKYTLMGEGLAVMVDGYWDGLPLDQWVSEQLSAGTLPALRDLIDDFWGAGGGGDRGYGAAGHFVSWLRDTYGIDVVKRVYVSSNLDTAFQDELSLDATGLEAAWHSSIAD